jgi:hypothetical protein
VDGCNRLLISECPEQDISSAANALCRIAEACPTGHKTASSTDFRIDLSVILWNIGFDPFSIEKYCHVQAAKLPRFAALGTSSAHVTVLVTQGAKLGRFRKLSPGWNVYTNERNNVPRRFIVSDGNRHEMYETSLSAVSQRIKRRIRLQSLLHTLSDE